MVKKKDGHALRKRHECSPNFIGTVAKKGFAIPVPVFQYFVMFFGAFVTSLSISIIASSIQFLVPACRKKIS